MNFTDRLKNGIILGDGAIGTMLQGMGLQLGECPELWNDLRPDAVESIHKQYLKAGAQVFTTNTFGGSALKLRQYQLEKRTEALNQLGAKIARRVAGNVAYVAGSMGPTGEFLEPLGSVTAEEMKTSFARQAKGLQEGGVDFVQIETMSALEEAKLAVLAVQENTDLPIVVAMTFVKGKQSYRTVMGVSVAQVVRAFEPFGIAAIGSNCGNGIDEIIEIIREFRNETTLPLFAAANAGIPKIENNETIYAQNGNYFSDRLQLLIEAGAAYIAGCCGTTPEHIEKMAHILNQIGKSV